MAISGKYGKVSIPKIGDNEPIFVLRAQDKLGVAAIEVYRALVTSHGSPLAEALQKEIDAFRRWTGAKKIPD
jgi:hypothetical protein